MICKICLNPIDDAENIKPAFYFCSKKFEKKLIDFGINYSKFGQCELCTPCYSAACYCKFGKPFSTYRANYSENNVLLVEYLYLDKYMRCFIENDLIQKRYCYYLNNKQTFVDKVIDIKEATLEKMKCYSMLL